MSIGAILSSFANGVDNIDATPVMANFNALNNAGLGGSLDTSATLTGTTAGTAIIYQLTIGVFKAFLIYCNGYRNSSATEQTITLPGSAFTVGCVYLAGAGKTYRPYASGSPLSSKVNQLTALAAGGGTTATQNAVGGSYSLGEITSAFDAIGLGTGQASTTTGLALFVGI